MKFRKNQNKEIKVLKENKPRVYKVNPRKKIVIGLWVLLALSFSFAIYPGFPPTHNYAGGVMPRAS